MKPRLIISRWGRLHDTLGGFHIGFFFDWEPWQRAIGIDLGFWCVSVEFPIRITKQRKRALLAKEKALA